jgi:STE24 endopeptidase
MTFRAPGVLRALLALVVLVAISQAAWASIAPNALERRVSAIPAQQLLVQPAAMLADPDRQLAAERLMRWKVPGWFVMIVLQIAALWYFWRSGAAAALRDRLRRGFASEFWVRWVFGVVLGAIAELAALVPTFYLYRVERVMGLSTQLSRDWALDWLVGFVVTVLAAGFVAAVVLFLADRTHQWYVYAILGVVVASMLSAYVNPILIAPIFNRFSPLSASYERDLEALAQRAGMPGIPVVVDDRSQRTLSERAFVIGLGASQRIVLSDTLISASTPPEVAFYEARELGNAAWNETLRRALLLAIIAICGAAMAVVIADRVGFRRDDDPVSRLALVGALMGCIYLLAVPVYSSFARAIAAHDDAYALALTNDRAAAVRAMVRRADERLESVCPNLIATLYFQRTPSIADRVAAFNGVAESCP